MNASPDTIPGSGSSGQTASAPLSRRSFILLYVALMVAMLLGALDQTIFSTALPTIVGELHGLEHMAWVTTAYILAATVVMPLYGKLGDLLGRRNVFIAAIGLFTVGSAVAALADTMGTLITGRAIQGLGGGGLMILAQAIIADLVPARDRAKYMAPIGAVFGLSSVVGPILGGWFTDEHSWRWALWMNVPLGLLAIAVALIALRLPKPTGEVNVDYWGSGLLIGATSCTVLVATWGGTEYDWTSSTIVGLAIGAAAGWVAFVLVERRAVEPVIPPKLFRNRTFVITTMVGMITAGIGMFAIIAYLPTYLQMVYGTSATESGLMLLPMIGGLMATAMLSGTVVSRIGRLKMMLVVGTAVVAAAALLLSTIDTSTSLWLLCSYLLLAGAGLGLLMQNLVLAAQDEFNAREVGTVTSSNNFFREIGASLGTAVIGSVFASRLADHLTASAAEGALGQVEDVRAITPSVVRELPDAARETIVNAYADSLVPLFGYLIPLFLLSSVLTLFLKDKELASGAPLSKEPEGNVSPRETAGHVRSL